jgi:hypothetical protein
MLIMRRVINSRHFIGFIRDIKGGAARLFGTTRTLTYVDSRPVF